MTNGSDMIKPKTEDCSPPGRLVPFLCKPYEVRLLLLFRQQWGRTFEVDTDAMTVQEIRYSKKVSFGTAEEKIEFSRQLG